jgi:hypothetical protein
MALVNNAKELRQLLGQLQLPVRTTDQLCNLLERVHLAQSEAPAVQQALLELKGREVAAQSHARELEHQEVMRALELGHPLPDPNAVRWEAVVLRTTAGAVAALATLVTVGLAGCAVGATAILVHRIPEAAVLPLCLLWVVFGVVGIVTVFGSLYVLNRLRLDLKKLGRLAPPPPAEAEPPAAVPVDKAPAAQGQFWERKHES